MVWWKLTMLLMLLPLFCLSQVLAVPKESPYLTLYVPGGAASAARPLDVVVEVTNQGGSSVRIADHLEVVRVVPPGKGMKESNVIREAAPAGDGTLRVIIECHPPAGSPGTPPVSPSPSEGKAKAVAPKASRLLKATVPAEFLAPGECRLVAVLRDGAREIARSEPITVAVSSATTQDFSVQLAAPKGLWPLGQPLPLAVKLRNDGWAPILLLGHKGVLRGPAPVDAGSRPRPSPDEMCLVVWCESTQREAGRATMLTELSGERIAPNEECIVEVEVGPKQLVEGENVFQCTLQDGEREPIYAQKLVVRCEPMSEPKNTRSATSPVPTH